MNEKKRYLWLDAAKYIAIFAVVMNHIYGATYFDNYRVLLYTAFSVTLFTLVSGVTSAIDMERGFEIKTYLVSRIKRVIIPYIIASIICILFQYKLLNINILFKNLIAFSASPPYYFILFYIQLIIVAPYIYYVPKDTTTKSTPDYSINRSVLYRNIV